MLNIFDRGAMWRWFDSKFIEHAGVDQESATHRFLIACWLGVYRNRINVAIGFAGGLLTSMLVGLADVFFGALAFPVASLIWILLVFLSGKRQIPIAHAGNFTTLGERTYVQFGEGLQFVVPGISDVVEQSIQEITVDIDKTVVPTASNTEAIVDAAVIYRIANLFLYQGIANPVDTIRQVILQSLRVFARTCDYDELLHNHEGMADAVRHEVDMATDDWGIEITHVIVSDIGGDEETRSAQQEKGRTQMRLRGTQEFLRAVEEYVSRFVNTHPDMQKSEVLNAALLHFMPEGKISKDIKAIEASNAGELIAGVVAGMKGN